MDAQIVPQFVSETPFEWALQHIQLIGWPTVLGLGWKISRFLTRLEQRALAAETHITIVAESNKDIKATNVELKSALDGQVQAQRELAQSVHQLAEAIHHQSDMHAEQLELIRDLVIKQEVLAANQTALMTGLQRVVEQLISVVKG